MFTLKLVFLLNVLSLALANPCFGLLQSLLSGGTATGTPSTPFANWRLCGSLPSPNRGQVYTNDRNAYYCPVTICFNIPADDCCGYFGRQLC